MFHIYYKVLEPKLNTSSKTRNSSAYFIAFNDQIIILLNSVSTYTARKLRPNKSVFQSTAPEKYYISFIHSPLHFSPLWSQI
jgi:hypothetical protein